MHAWLDAYTNGIARDSTCAKNACRHPRHSHARPHI
jgi:hypothetical protein